MAEDSSEREKMEVDGGTPGNLAQGGVRSGGEPPKPCGAGRKRRGIERRESTEGRLVREIMGGFRDRFFGALPELRERHRYARTVEASIKEKFEEFLSVAIKELQEELETGDLRVEVRAAGNGSVSHDSGMAERLERIERELGEIKGAIGKRGAGVQEAPIRESYADRVKRVGEGQKKGEKTIVIRPAEGVTKTAEEVKKVVKETLQPKEGGLKIAGVRMGRTGVVVTTGDEGTWQVVTGHKGLKDKGLRVETPAGRMPRVAIFGMDRDIGKDDLGKLVHGQNFKGLMGEKEFLEGFIPLFRIGKRENPRGAWVVRCSGKIREAIMAEGRVFIGWDVCRVRDEAGITRCYRCQGYGHTSKVCKSPAICGHCAGGDHERKQCPHSALPPVCGNCKRFGRPHSHDVASEACPYYQRQLELVAKATSYGC